MPATNSPSRAARYPGVGRRQRGSPAWPLFAGLGPVGALDTAPRLARAFCALVLASWELSRLTDDCALIASELTANVVQQATGPDRNPRYEGGKLPQLWLRLLSDRARLRIECWDNLAPDRGVPELRHARSFEESGRGLELVDALSRDWGWDPLPAHGAKQVWALLPREESRP